MASEALSRETARAFIVADPKISTLDAACAPVNLEYTANLFKETGFPVNKGHGRWRTVSFALPSISLVNGLR
jgi:hypothetical protein